MKIYIITVALNLEESKLYIYIFTYYIIKDNCFKYYIINVCSAHRTFWIQNKKKGYLDVTCTLHVCRLDESRR